MRSVEHEPIVAVIDDPNHYNSMWMTGLNCVYGRGDHFFGFINFGDHSPLDVWTAANLGHRLGAEFLVWLATAHHGDELTGQRCLVFMVCDPEQVTLYQRPVRVTDDGQVLPDGDRIESVPDGWLGPVTQTAWKDWHAWTLGEQADVLRRAGHTVEVRT